MTKVSVIVPIYNTPPQYLHQCIDSLLAQTLESLEIILVNDASTDNTLDVLSGYVERFPGRICLIDSKENRHQGGARNLGISTAKGEYIAFMDSDDMALPHMYRTLYEKAMAENADTVLCRWRRFSDEGSVSDESVIPSVWKDGNIAKGKEAALFLNPQSVWCKLYRRSMVLKNKIFFPEKLFYEDNAWCPLCMLYVQRYAYVDEALYQYRLNPTSTTEGGNFQKYMDRCRSALWLDAELKNRGLYESVADAADFWFYHCYYASAAKMCVTGYGRIHMRQLNVLRDRIIPERKRYFSNPYFLKNIRNYETEDMIYQKLLLRVPVLGIAVIKTIEFLRKLKHGRR